MQRRDSDGASWYFIPVRPGSEANARRWNVVIISMLAALVLGLLLTAVLPEAPGSTAHKPPNNVHHV